MQVAGLMVFMALAAAHGKVPVAGRTAIDPAVAADRASLDALRDHIYEKTPMDLVEEARTVVAQRGFAPQDSEDPLGFDTAWKKDPKGGQVRFHVLILAISTEKAQAKFVLQHQDPERATPDLAASWTLLQKVDPDGAKELAAQAPALPKPRATPSARPSPARRPGAAGKPGAADKPSPTGKPAAKHTPIQTPEPAASPDDQQ